MSEEQHTRAISALRVLVGIAAAFVVIAGLKAAKDILLPILFAMGLSVLAAPPVGFLKRRLKVPQAIGIPLVVLSIAGALVLFGTIMGGALSGFDEAIPKYTATFNTWKADFLGWMDSLPAALRERVEPAVEGFDYSSLVRSVLRAVQVSFASILGVLTQTVLVALIMTFMLFEATDFTLKLQAAFGRGGNASQRLAQANQKVGRYLSMKTAISAVTGLLCGLLCLVVGVDFAVLWGLLAFLLNFVPSVGSIIAAIPAVLMALLGIGPVAALIVGGGYLGVNFAIGNVLEPRLMGQSLGLSPVVVILSLLFWSYLWGPSGALLSVPMTVVVKLLLESSPDTRWLALLLGSGAEARAYLASQAAGDVDLEEKTAASYR